MSLQVSDLNLPADKLAQLATALGDDSGANAALQGICDSATADAARLTAGYAIDDASLLNWERTIALYRAYSQAQFGEIPKAVADDYKTAWDELTAIAQGRRPNLAKVTDPGQATIAGGWGGERRLRGRAQRCLWLAWLMMGAAVFLARGTPVYLSLQQLTGSSATARYTLIGDANENPWTDGTNIYGGGVIQRTATNGVDVVDLAPIGYTLVCPGWNHTLHFVVPPGTNAWNIVNLLTNGVSPLQPINYVFSWTATNLDGAATNQVQWLVQQYLASGGTNGVLPLASSASVTITNIGGTNYPTVNTNYDAAGAAAAVYGANPSNYVSAGSSPTFMMVTAVGGLVGPHYGDGNGLTNLNSTRLTGTLPLNTFPPEVVTNINPFMFGGVGDGVADDTAAVQAAINAASTVALKKRQIDLRNHTWRVSSTLYITNEYVWFGNGAIITTNHIHAIWSANDQVHFHDLIVGGPSTNYQATDCGIWVSNNAYILQNSFDTVKVTNFWDDIYVNFGVETRFNHCYITSQGMHGIDLYACDETEIANSALGMSMAGSFNNDGQATGCGTGWSQTNSIAVYCLAGGQGFYIHNCDFNECGSALYVDAGYNGSTIIHLDKNNFEQFYHPTLPCVVFTNVVVGEISNNHFHNDLFSGSTNAAIGVYNNPTYTGLFIHNNVHTPYYTYVDTWNALPDVLGDHSGNYTGLQTILQHSTFGDAGTYRSPTVLDGNNAFDSWLHFDNGVQGNGGMLLGGNNGGYGYSANTTKGYQIGSPAYGDSHMVGWLRFLDNGTAQAALYLGNDSYGASPGVSSIYFGTSPNDSTAPTNYWDLDYTGRLFPLVQGTGFGGTGLMGTFSNVTANAVSAKTFAGDGSALTNNGSMSVNTNAFASLKDAANIAVQAAGLAAANCGGASPPVYATTLAVSAINVLTNGTMYVMPGSCALGMRSISQWELVCAECVPGTYQLHTTLGTAAAVGAGTNLWITTWTNTPGTTTFAPAVAAEITGPLGANGATNVWSGGEFTVTATNVLMMYSVNWDSGTAPSAVMEVSLFLTKSN